MTPEKATNHSFAEYVVDEFCLKYNTSLISHSFGIDVLKDDLPKHSRSTYALLK